MAKFAVPGVPADGAADRHHPGADHPRHLHRARRGGDQQFCWVFYIFGLFLVYTASSSPRRATEDDDEYEENTAGHASPAEHLPLTDEWHGLKLSIKENGKRLITPMFLVILALGTTDLLFALDSIPAIYGLTKEPYLVFTANVFALMGLRQLYFLIGGLLQRLVYLSYGLAFLLVFIGVKLILHAMHENELPFINGGEPIAGPRTSRSGCPSGHHRHPGGHRGRQPGQGPGRPQEGRRRLTNQRRQWR